MFMYPWGDFHSLNLGWFLVQFKEWVDKIQEYLDNGGGTSENLANVIAPVFNAANSYLTGDYVLYNDELYKANQAISPGTWNPDAWTRCLVTEEMGSGSGGVDNVARLMIAGQYSNTYNYQKYAICRYNDKLWMCNTNLPAGGEEWEPSHWDEITVGAGLTGLRRSVDTLANAITDLQNIVGDGTLSGFTATNLTGAANELKGSLNSNESAIAIISNGNTHSAISAGEYVYVKNHSTISEGLYKAKTAIAANATLTLNTNIASVSKGTVNDLFDTEYTTDGLTFLDWTSQGEYGKIVYRYGGYCKIGRLVIVNMRISVTDNVIASGSEMVTGLPPVAIEAASNIAVGAIANNQNKNITLTQGGVIAATDSIPVTNMIALFCCYLTY